ncbi:hypothetical protein VE02_06922 [Pseudogymnoascus sp. 03VT05]|nr:hypothetical protein VE02_06922 [Pseudogymnoascus sp. 03VT05]
MATCDSPASPTRRYAKRMTRLVESQNAELSILRKEVKEYKEILETRKKRTTGKRIKLQGEFVFSTEEVLKIVREAELKSTEKRPRGRPRKRLIEEVEEEIEEEECNRKHAVLQLSTTVLRYLVDVKDASADRKSLIHEMSSTRGILSTLNETVVDARVSDESWLSSGNRHQKGGGLTSMALQARSSNARNLLCLYLWRMITSPLSREIRNNTEAIREDVAGLSRELAAAQLDAKTDAEFRLGPSWNHGTGV